MRIFDAFFAKGCPFLAQQTKTGNRSHPLTLLPPPPPPPPPSNDLVALPGPLACIGIGMW